MKEYICKEDLLQAFEENLKYQEDKGYWQVAKCTKLTINKIGYFPVADVAPVVHGKWIPRNKSLLGSDYHCSICDNIANESNSGHYDRLTHYCSNCGARMDKENQK